MTHRTFPDQASPAEIGREPDGRQEAPQTLPVDRQTAGERPVGGLAGHSIQVDRNEAADEKRRVLAKRSAQPGNPDGVL
ncbi:MAG: hypothetical protein AAB215_01485, partial [Planctomycetota bacterium]